MCRNRISEHVICTGSRCALLLLVAVSSRGAIAGETIDPEDNGSQYVWAENIGWLNAEPSGDGGPGMSLAPDHVEGWLWAENVGWISLSCENTESCTETEYRVTHDGGGNLSGHGWAENVGWISFSCVDSDSCASSRYGIVIDTRTGELSGYAWGENLGWMSFSCLDSASCDSQDYGITTDPVPLEHVFSDGMESGDTTSWSETIP